MFETVVPIQIQSDVADLSPYALHQHVDRLMRRSPTDVRDYVYAFDPESGAVYLRAGAPRDGLADWRAYAVPTDGQSVRLSGVLYFDASASRKHQRADGAMFQPTNWRDPERLGARIVSAMSISDAARVGVITACPNPAIDMGKPGPRVMINPILFSADVVVENAAAMRGILARGIGRGKSFGFGCVQWRAL